jgi:hypothetical protein
MLKKKKSGIGLAAEKTAKGAVKAEGDQKFT